jgi:hypothetical protein
MQSGKVVPAFLAALWGGHPAWAGDLGARSQARGETGRADGSDTSAVRENLAALTLGTRYELVVGGGFGADDLWYGRAAGFDSRTAPVGLGVAYDYRYDDLPPIDSALPGWKEPGEILSDPTVHQSVSLGVAYPFIARRLTAGSTLRFDWRTAALAGKDNAFDLDLSAAGRPFESLTVAVGARNLLPGDYPDTARTLDLSGRWDPGPYLGIEADAVWAASQGWVPGSFSGGAGLDIAAIEWLGLRGGWARRGGSNFVGGGIGLLNERASFDYGLQAELGTRELRMWHAFDLRAAF